MPNNQSLIIAIAWAIFFTSELTASYAAEPAFCKQYANAAVNQVRAGNKIPACAGSIQGARWSPEHGVHYAWCLGATHSAAGIERIARTQILKACAGR